MVEGNKERRKKKIIAEGKKERRKWEMVIDKERKDTQGLAFNSYILKTKKWIGHATKKIYIYKVSSIRRGGRNFVYVRRQQERKRKLKKAINIIITRTTNINKLNKYK